MTEIEQKILCFALLPPEEKAEIETLAAKEPAYAALLEEARGFHRNLTRAGLHLEDENEADVLAYLTVSRLSERRPLSPEYDAAHAEWQKRIAQDPELSATYERYQERAQALEAASKDPIAQFEALSGHKLEDFDPPEGPKPGADREPAVPPRRHRMLSRRATFVFMAFLLLAATFPMIRFQTQLAQYTALQPQAYLPEGFNIQSRGEGTDLDTTPTPEVFTFGLAAIQDAQEPCYLIHVCYRDSTLQQGHDLIDVALSRPDASAVLRQNMYLVKAKLLLAVQDWEGAYGMLRKAEGEAGPHGKEIQKSIAFAQSRLN